MLQLIKQTILHTYLMPDQAKYFMLKILRIHRDDPS